MRSKTMTETQRKHATDGDFYYTQSDHVAGERRVELLMKARDLYLQAGEVKMARIVEKAIDRNRLPV
jgi:hypothetical protein